MSDGLFNQSGSEQFSQKKLTRHRGLVVNTSASGDLFAGQAFPTATSSYASVDPGDVAAGDGNMGPHFTMSGETSDLSHTYGFHFSLLNFGFAGDAAVPDDGGFTVTVWTLLENWQIPQPSPAIRQPWVSLNPRTGVNYREWWHSFDLNATAVRFQFTNVLTDGNIFIAFAEL